ncbi:MAG TPA: ferrochelatase [Acidimicrobiales bacterium]|nr:ferrochelatase [Acidimicrobiales bacterium]
MTDVEANAGTPVGVLVMAHGTPRDPAEITPFYTRIRRGRPPTPEQLEDLERRYAAIGGLSPLTERTEAQVHALRSALQRGDGDPYVVAFGAKHTAPFIEDGVETLVRQGVRHIIGLVLTPHGSSMGSGEYFDRVTAALPDGVSFSAISHWYDDPAFVAVMADRVTAALDSGAAGQERQPVVFTAHSLPARIRQSGDTYVEQMEDSAALVAAAAGLTRWQVAWQSAGRTPEPWLGPDIREVVRQLGDKGDIDRVVVCPIGFVADHLEVLYDIDIELAAVANEVGLTVVRTSSLNDDPAFITALAGVVVAAAEGV